MSEHSASVPGASGDHGPARASKRETKPHTLTAVVDDHGEVRLTLLCPYTLTDRAVRFCLMGVEPSAVCEWDWFDKGEHHKDCPALNDRTAECRGIDPDLGCWPERPEECDGFQSTECGHVHPIEGCWALEVIGEIGWDEAVRWAKDGRPEGDLMLPMQVEVSCDEDGVELAAWAVHDGGGTDGL